MISQRRQFIREQSMTWKQVLSGVRFIWQTVLNYRMTCHRSIILPHNQKPLELGADFVVEAITKYINGHGDAQGGAILSNDLETMDRIRYEAQVNVADKTVEHFCAALEVVTFAVSLGHDESLIFPQPSYDERIHLYPERFRNGFIRFSVGLEDPDDIILDLDQALKAIGL